MKKLIVLLVGLLFVLSCASPFKGIKHDYETSTEGYKFVSVSESSIYIKNGVHVWCYLSYEDTKQIDKEGYVYWGKIVDKDYNYYGRSYIWLLTRDGDVTSFTLDHFLSKAFVKLKR